MPKRGQLVLKAVIDLIISAAIIFAFPYIGQSFGSGDVYKKEIVAKEIALIIDSLYAYPYDIVVYYEQDLTGFIIEISNDEVIVYSITSNGYDSDLTYKKYKFFQTGDNVIKAKLESPKRIKFEKQTNQLTITKDEINKK